MSTLSARLARTLCCESGCANPDACRAETQTQLIPIHTAAQIVARCMPALLCERWRATGPMSRERVVEGKDEE